MEWSNWDKKTAECCPKGYEGTFSRCQSCGEPQRWGPGCVEYTPSTIPWREGNSTHGLEHGWRAETGVNGRAVSGLGPTKAVALQDLKEKVWQREREERLRKAIEEAATAEEATAPIAGAGTDAHLDAVADGWVFGVDHGSERWIDEPCCSVCWTSVSDSTPATWHHRDRVHEPDPHNPHGPFACDFHVPRKTATPTTTVTVHPLGSGDAEAAKAAYLRSWFTK